MTIVSEAGSGAKFVDVIKVEEEKIRQHVDEMVRQSVEETLNGLLEVEAEQLCGARRYERSPDRVDTRSGHYERKLTTKAGEVTLKVQEEETSSVLKGRLLGGEMEDPGHVGQGATDCRQNLERTAYRGRTETRQGRSFDWPGHRRYLGKTPRNLRPPRDCGPGQRASPHFSQLE